MKGVISARLNKILNDPELTIKFFREQFGVEFINPPDVKPKSKPRPKRKRSLLSILLGR
jgi:hypothetical protein